MIFTTNSSISVIKKWSWLFILLVAVGGLWYPKLGLLLLPIMLLLPLLGFTKGKFWCGNICPHGSFFDRFLWSVSRNGKIPAWIKAKTTVFLAFSFFVFMLGKRILSVLPLWGTAPFFDKLGFIFVVNYLVVTILGILLGFLISPRSWCQFCPMGTFQMIFYRLGLYFGVNEKTDARVTFDNDKCLRCGKCSRVCPMQLKPYCEFADGDVCANAACIRCGSCINSCPTNALNLGKRRMETIMSFDDTA